MGAVLNPVIGSNTGALQGTAYTGGAIAGVAGSGDLGQNLLPVAMKIAAQAIGLDLVAVKPTPGPKIDLLYIDFQYDDTRDASGEGRPQVFKLTSAGSVAQTDAVIATISAFVTAAGFKLTQGGIQGGQVFCTSSHVAAAGGGGLTTNASAVAAASKQGSLEFLGFSRIDGYPMFRAYRQSNSQNVGSLGYPYLFDQTLNTFTATASLTSQLLAI